MDQEKTSLKVMELANFFQKKMENSKHWHVSLEEIIEITGFDITNYIQNLYTFDQSDFVSHLEKIDAENIGHFLHFLDKNYHKGSLKIFSKQGIFLTSNQRVDLSDYFFTTIIDISANHSIDYDNFRAMFTHFKSFNRAWECYENEYFSPEELKARLMNKYLQHKTNSPAHDFCVYRYLEQLFQRKIIIPRAFLGEIVEKLFAYIFPEKNYHDSQEHTPHTPEKNPTREALIVLGFNSLPDLHSLKSRFKKLMKQFHPDVNPKGLEKSKTINMAYQQILIIIKKGVTQNGE